jgi:hypothetical protein
MPHARSIPLNKIRVDGDTQPRERIDETTVAEYAEDMANGNKFPSVKVYSDGTDFWLYDGFHRVLAARRAGKADILCEVQSGTQQDAQLAALGTNRDHGMRRTAFDKKRAVVRCLKHPTVIKDKWSTEKIAAHCGVSASYVSETRKDLNIAPAHPERARSDRPSMIRRESSPPKAPENKGGIGLAEIDRAHAPSLAERVAAEEAPLTTAEGQEVPKRLIPDFSRRAEVTEMMGALSSIKTTVLGALDNRDKLYQDVARTAFQSAMENARRELSNALPHALCPYCKADGCKACHNRGWVSKTVWANAPGDIRARSKK